MTPVAMEWGRAILILIVALVCEMTVVRAFAQDDQNGDARHQGWPEYWRKTLLAPPTRRDPGGTEIYVAPPDQYRGLIQVALKELTRKALYGSGETNTFLTFVPSLLMGVLEAKDASAQDSWPYITPGSQYSSKNFSELPDWFLAAFDKEVEKFSLDKRESGVRYPPHGGRQKGHWQLDDRVGDAFAWAGPSVKEGAATYRPVGNGMAVRIAMTAKMADEAYSWASTYGLPLEIRLRRDETSLYPHSPVVILGRTRIPVWIANPDGLMPATLTAFSIGGDACDGSQWMELSYSGTGTPPVWAVLGFADRTDAKNVKVRRVAKSPSSPDAYLEVQRSEIELRWRNDQLPSLRILARRFDWIATEYQEAESSTETMRHDLVGHAWGTQIFTFMPEALAPTSLPRKYEDVPESMLSSAGTPRCAPP